MIVAAPSLSYTYPNLFQAFCPKFSSLHHPCRFRLKKLTRNNRIWASIGSYEVGGGYPELEKDEKRTNRKSRSEPTHTESFLRGGDQVISVLEEMITLVSYYYCYSYYYGKMLHLFSLELNFVAYKVGVVVFFSWNQIL